jgi:DNA-binding NarL/FixJ family response regulator
LFASIPFRLFVTERTVEAHVKQIFLKLRLAANPESHWVLAVLAYLRAGTRVR